MININKEEKHQEALKRMELLNIDFDVIQDFKDNGTVYMSINGFNIPVFDFLIDEIVAKTNLKNPYVYYLIQDDAKMVSILFVSNYKEDWEAESLSIVEDIVYPYVLNFSEPNYSEIGAIKVNNIDGCLVRIS